MVSVCSVQSPPVRQLKRKALETRGCILVLLGTSPQELRTHLQKRLPPRKQDICSKSYLIVCVCMCVCTCVCERACVGLPRWLRGKESANAGDTGSIPGLGRSPGGGKGNPLQYSCLENPMDQGAWCITVHGVAKSLTQLRRLSTHACTSMCVFACKCVRCTDSHLLCEAGKYPDFNSTAHSPA